MANGHSEEFKRDAVRIALTSGLTRRQVASDLVMGVSTLNAWIKLAQETEDASLPDAGLLREVERLRKENSVLRQEREILKKATAFFARHEPTTARRHGFSGPYFLAHIREQHRLSLGSYGRPRMTEE